MVLLAHLTAGEHADALAFRDYIEFVTMVGLRIEEALRLDTEGVSLDGSRPSFTVPGLKTSTAQASLPLPPAAAAVLRRRRKAVLAGIDEGAFQRGERRFWPYEYRWAAKWWDQSRFLIGATQPTATLKALRRNAARYLHVDLGMPLDMVRHYLRHEGIATTMEYLRLTGGYGTEEMARYFDGEETA